MSHYDEIRLVEKNELSRASPGRPRNPCYQAVWGADSARCGLRRILCLIARSYVTLNAEKVAPERLKLIGKQLNYVVGLNS